MALGTLGSNATTTLVSINGWTPATANADITTMAINIKDDLNPRHPIWPGAFQQSGLLFVPNRGVLKVLKGDYIAYDGSGWPILVSANSIAHASSWTHS